MRGWLFRLIGLGVIMVYCALAAAQTPTAAQSGSTATARAGLQATMIARRTPLPSRYLVQRVATRVLEKVDFRVVGVGAIAADAAGTLYVGDGMTTVHVLAPDLTEQRQFKAQQPFALAVSSKGRLYIGQHFDVNIDLYNADGSLVRRLWSESQGTLDTLAMAPDDTLYVAWQTNNPPRIAYLTRLDAEGNLLFTREFAHPLGGGNTVHSLAIAPDGSVTMAVSGFGLTSYDFYATLLSFTALGDLIRGQPALVLSQPPLAPAGVARLKDNSLVMYSLQSVGWWSATAQYRGELDANALRDGWPPTPGYVRHLAITLRPDGQSIYFVEMRSSGELQTGIVQFVDTQAPTGVPVSSPTRVPVGTPTATTAPQ